jgi:hypothetical protein
MFSHSARWMIDNLALACLFNPTITQKDLGFYFLSMSELWERDNLGYQQLLAS